MYWIVTFFSEFSYIFKDTVNPRPRIYACKCSAVHELFDRSSNNWAIFNATFRSILSSSRLQSEVVVRVRPKSIQHRFLKHVRCSEFLAWSPGRWTLGEATVVRCRRSYTVLAASARAGPEVVEIGNCVATR